MMGFVVNIRVNCSKESSLKNKKRKSPLLNEEGFFLVAQVHLHWNHICSEILSWRRLIEATTPSIKIPNHH